MNQSVFRLLRFVASAIVLTWILTGCGRSVSGTYLAQGSKYASFLQLTQTPDKRVLGTLQSITLQPDGTLNRSSVGVSGAVDGESLTLTLDPGYWGGQRNLSGRATPDAIDLVLDTKGELGKHAIFKRAELSSFEAAARELSSQAAALAENLRRQQQLAAEARARAQQAKKEEDLVEQVAGELERVVQQQDRIAARYSAFDQRYAAGIDRARKMLERERRLVGVGTGDAKREAAGVNRDLAGLMRDAEGLNRDLRLATAELERSLSSLNLRASEGRQYCAGDQHQTSGGGNAHRAQCQRLAVASQRFDAMLPIVASLTKTTSEAMGQSDQRLKEIKAEADLLLR